MKKSEKEKALVAAYNSLYERYMSLKRSRKSELNKEFGIPILLHDLKNLQKIMIEDYAMKVTFHSLE